MTTEISQHLLTREALYASFISWDTSPQSDEESVASSAVLADMQKSLNCVFINFLSNF